MLFILISNPWHFRTQYSILLHRFPLALLNKVYVIYDLHLELAFK
jgi:hypothetical protein